MEKDLSHQIDVDVEVLLGGVDLVMAQHLFDLINGVTHVEKILGIGVAQSSRRRKGALRCFMALEMH